MIAAQSTGLTESSATSISIRGGPGLLPDVQTSEVKLDAVSSGADFRWFTVWAYSHVSLTMTLAKASSEEDIRVAYGAGLFLDRLLTWRDSIEATAQAATSSGPRPPLSDRSRELLKRMGRSPEEIDQLDTEQPLPRVAYLRVAARDGWGVGLESTSNRGSDEAVLRALSRGRTAVSYCLNPKLSTLVLARTGELICGIDTAVPDTRWGKEPAFFDHYFSAIGDAGSVSPTPGDVAAVLHEAFGFRLKPEILEAPLLSAPLAV
jgi:Family of unknown function (DUF6461)